METIPETIMNSITEKNLEIEKKTKTINDIAMDVFQKFSSLSIFIDSEWFLNLDKTKLIKFNYELRDFYVQNFSEDQKKLISSENILYLTDSGLSNKSIEDIQKYILSQMDILLENKKEELKYMINYILIGALGIVIPEIKELYPDFSFSFM